MQPDQPTTGDYGYDLVHDDVAVRRGPLPEPRSRPADAPGAWDERQRAATDYSYDQAHGM